MHYIPIYSVAGGRNKNRPKNKPTDEFLTTPHLYALLGVGDRS